MFSQIQSASNGKDECHGVIDCFDVRYVVYFNSDGRRSETNTYVVHSDSNGLIRRDCCPMVSNFDWGGPFTVFYGSAK